MSDRISQFRTIRLSHHPGASDRGQWVWALSISETRTGVPHGSVLARGVLDDLPAAPTPPEIWEAILGLADLHCGGYGFEGRAEHPEPPDGGYGGEVEITAPLF